MIPPTTPAITIKNSSRESHTTVARFDYDDRMFAIRAGGWAFLELWASPIVEARIVAKARTP